MIIFVNVVIFIGVLITSGYFMYLAYDQHSEIKDLKAMTDYYCQTGNIDAHRKYLANEYFGLVNANRMTIYQVPEVVRKDVEELIDNYGM